VLSLFLTGKVLEGYSKMWNSWMCGTVVLEVRYFSCHPTEQSKIWCE